MDSVNCVRKATPQQRLGADLGGPAIPYGSYGSDKSGVTDCSSRYIMFNLSIIAMYELG